MSGFVFLEKSLIKKKNLKMVSEEASLVCFFLFSIITLHTSSSSSKLWTIVGP